MKDKYLVLTVLLAGYWIGLNGQVSPRQGDILISEIMVNPGAVSDSNGEWFELWNATNHDLDMNGLSILDAGSNHHLIHSDERLVLPAKGYWVLARNGDLLTNGGVTANYVYQNFTLGNTSDQIMITNSSGGLIDQVSYSEGWPISSGASMECLGNFQGFSENDFPEHWLAAKTVFGSGDKGSPGRANPVIAGVEPVENGLVTKVFPNPIKGSFTVEVNLEKPESGCISLINLLGQGIAVRSFPSRAHFQESFSVAGLPPGLWFLEIRTARKKQIQKVLIE